MCRSATALHLVLAFCIHFFCMSRILWYARLGGCSPPLWAQQCSHDLYEQNNNPLRSWEGLLEAFLSGCFLFLVVRAFCWGGVVVFGVRSFCLGCCFWLFFVCFCCAFCAPMLRLVIRIPLLCFFVFCLFLWGLGSRVPLPPSPSPLGFRPVVVSRVFRFQLCEPKLCALFWCSFQQTWRW